MANPFHLAEGNTPKGFLYMLVAMISFALYSSLGNIRAQRLGGAIQTCIPFLIASVFNLLILIMLKEPVFSGITLRSCPVLLYIGFAFWIMVFLYVFPLLARFENTVFGTIRNAILPAMRRLRDATGETVSLYCKHGIHRVCVEQAVSTHELRRSSHPGYPYPLWAGAIAKIFLSYMTPEEVERVRLEAPPARQALWDSFLEEAQAARTRGYSFSNAEREEGIASVAYVALALMGVAVGAQFCQNILYRQGAVGELYSAGTIFWMNVTVGVKVITGIGSISLLMIGLLAGRDASQDA